MSGIAPAIDVLRLAEAYRASAAVYAATKLGLPDHLASGSRTSLQLAEPTDTDEPSLCRLLRALCALGLCREEPPGSFGPPGNGADLQPGGAMRGLALLLGGEHYRVWGELTQSVRTGPPVVCRRPRAPGSRSTWRERPSPAAFDESMTALTEQTRGRDAGGV